MQKSGGGSIVNFSSISGFVGQEFVHMGYNAAKGAIRLLTKSAAAQYGKDGHPRQLRASGHHAADAYFRH